MSGRRNNVAAGAQIHRGSDDAGGKAQAQSLIRDRIKELRRVPARELLPSARNWRKHPPNQRAALRKLLTDIGYAQALLARELDDGSLELIDGHMRAGETPNALVPVLVLDVDEKEAARILATLDPLSAMAETDSAALQSLLSFAGDDLSLEEMVDLSELTELQDAVEIEIGEPSRIPGDPRRIVKAVMALDDVGVFERALAATGLANRADAIKAICEHYLTTHLVNAA